MKDIEITVSEDYAFALNLIASALGLTVSEVVIQALENTWNLTQEQRETENEPLPF